MARGNFAKEDVISKLRQAFGADYLGVVDKKIYVLGKEGNEKIQVAISLTCPKTPIEIPNKPSAAPTAVSFGTGMNFEDIDFNLTLAPQPKPAEIPQEELDLVQELLKKFDL